MSETNKIPIHLESYDLFQLWCPYLKRLQCRVMRWRDRIEMCRPAFVEWLYTQSGVEPDTVLIPFIFYKELVENRL
jgi:hypothetical protein